MNRWSVLFGMAFITGTSTGTYLAKPIGSGHSLFQSYPDGVLVVDEAKKAVEFGRNGQPLVRISIYTGNFSGNSAIRLQVCEPDSRGVRKLVLLIPPLGDERQTGASDSEREICGATP